MYKELQKLRKKVNNTYKDKDRICIIKALDKAQTALKTWTFTYTDFLDPFKRRTVLDVLNEIRGLDYTVFGGYDDAIRSSIILYCDGLTEDMIDIHDIFSVVSVTRSGYAKKLGHRDYLGAVMNLGLSRNFFGDILVNPDGCMIIGKKDVIELINSSLVNVGKYKVSTELKKFKDLIIPEQKFKTVTTTVPSLRLDCLISAGFNVSRSDSLKYVNSGKAFVNYREVTNVSSKISQNTVISCKGLGKMDFLEILGTTRKDRLKVKIKVYVN